MAFVMPQKADENMITYFVNIAILFTDLLWGILSFGFQKALSKLNRDLSNIKILNIF